MKVTDQQGFMLIYEKILESASKGSRVAQMRFAAKSARKPPLGFVSS